MQLLRRYRGYVILTLVYAILFGGYLLYERRPQPEPIAIVEPSAAPSLTPAPLQVHVVGAVARPGIYTLPAASRLAQAIEAAGGLAAEANPEAINLAAPVRDGEQVYVPRRDETPSPQRAGPAGSAVGNAGEASSGGALVNINTATVAELDTLPGIGPTYAQRIIEYRQANGPFTDTAQIMAVKGIGQATYDQIKARITVR